MSPVPGSLLVRSITPPRSPRWQPRSGHWDDPSCRMLGVAAVALLAIYPEGHFDKVHKCTESNFDDLIKTSVDAGKTLFVRWIASEG